MQWYDDWDLIQNIFDGGKWMGINGEMTGLWIDNVEADEYTRACYFILSIFVYV